MGDSSLKEVHLVDVSQNNIQAFRKALREVFPDSSASHRSLHQTSTVHLPRKRKIAPDSKNFPLVTTEEGLAIMLKKGSIEGATVSVLNYAFKISSVFLFCFLLKNKHKPKNNQP